MSRIRHLVEELKSQISQKEIIDLKNQPPDILLDCREKEEVDLGVISGSVWIPKGQVDLVFEEKFPDKNNSIMVYCESGFRSILVAKTLLDLGYKKVYSLTGGIKAWKNLGEPISLLTTSKQINKTRYLSQLRVPEIGELGQQKIQQARVLIVGAGGLGSPVAYYLAAAGVGTIGIMDSDKIDESNLQRQILHTTDRIGLLKVESAYLTLKALNPHLKINADPRRATAENIDHVIKDYDIIIDGCDNFESRYLINMACVKNKKINVHGSVLRFQGQVAVFGQNDGPCYSCLFPVPPSGELEMDCAEGGVLGATVGLVGTLMCVETIKIIIGQGQSLNGRMLAYDGLQSEFVELQISKDKHCTVCGPNADLDYNKLETFIFNCRGK